MLNHVCLSQPYSAAKQPAFTRNPVNPFKSGGGILDFMDISNKKRPPIYTDITGIIQSMKHHAERVTSICKWPWEQTPKPLTEAEKSIQPGNPISGCFRMGKNK